MSVEPFVAAQIDNQSEGRFGSKPDEIHYSRHVRFPPENGRQAELFDHFISGDEEAGRQGQSEGLRCFKIDDSLVFGWRLYRQVARLGTTKDMIDVQRCLPILLDSDNPIGHQVPRGDKELVAVDRR